MLSNDGALLDLFGAGDVQTDHRRGRLQGFCGQRIDQQAAQSIELIKHRCRDFRLDTDTVRLDLRILSQRDVQQGDCAGAADRLVYIPALDLCDARLASLRDIKMCDGSPLSPVSWPCVLFARLCHGRQI